MNSSTALPMRLQSAYFWLSHSGLGRLGHHGDAEEPALGVQGGGELVDERREVVAVGRLQVLPVEVDAVVAHVPDEGDEVVDEAATAVGRSQHRRRDLTAERLA